MYTHTHTHTHTYIYITEREREIYIWASSIANAWLLTTIFTTVFTTIFTTTCACAYSLYCYMCPHATICFLILLYICPHTTTYLSSFCYVISPHTTKPIYVCMCVCVKEHHKTVSLSMLLARLERRQEEHVLADVCWRMLRRNTTKLSHYVSSYY